jgi:nucleoside-diphosphate-sugar epimerase/CBS domain-containing protein
MRNLRFCTVREDRSVKEAMAVTDRSGLQMSFVISREGRLVGCVSDGDIRRAILKGMDIHLPVSGIMNAQPISLLQSDRGDSLAAQRTVRRLQSALRGAQVIPMTDAQGRLVDLLACRDLLPFQVSRSVPTRAVRRILVVGGAGYLGAVLTRRLLKKGYFVRVLDLLMFGRQSVEELKRAPKFELIVGDVRNIGTTAAALRGMDAVINLAALVGDPACSASPEDAIATNFLANKALAEACKYHQVNRYLFASTCSVYGVGKDRLDENAPLHPVSLYARSKIRSEEAVLGLEDANFSPTILRMATLYGYSPRMRYDLVLNRMTMTAVRDGKIFVHGDGRQWRPLLSVGDAAEAFTTCVEAPLAKVKGQVFNVGSDKNNVQIRGLADRISSVFQGRVEIVREGTESDQRNYFVSFRKLERTLQFRAGYGIETAVRGIRSAIRANRISDFENPHYYNVENNR